MATVVINKAIKYCIYPNDEQQDQIARTFGCVRKVYNMGLELQQGLYACDMGSMSNWDLNSYCNRVWKEEQPYLKEIDKFALTNSLLDLCSAFKNFFEKRNGYPKFKSRKEHYKSYSTNVTNNNIAVRGSGKKGQIKLPKLGWVNANIHRQPGAAWKIKSATVSQNAAGKHFVRYNTLLIPQFLPLIRLSVWTTAVRTSMFPLMAKRRIRLITIGKRKRGLHGNSVVFPAWSRAQIITNSSST